MSIITYLDTILFYIYTCFELDLLFYELIRYFE